MLICKKNLYTFQIKTGILQSNLNYKGFINNGVVQKPFNL